MALFLGLPEWVPGLLWGGAVALFFFVYATNFRNWVYREPDDEEDAGPEQHRTDVWSDDD